MIKYLKGLLYFFIPLIILNMLITILYNFDIISNNINNYLNILNVVISALISGLYIGNKSNNKGYLEGIKMGLIIIILLFLFNIIMIKNINIKTFIYYLGLMFLSTLGSMLGISKKTNN